MYVIVKNEGLNTFGFFFWGLHLDTVQTIRAIGVIFDERLEDDLPRHCTFIRLDKSYTALIILLVNFGQQIHDLVIIFELKFTGLNLDGLHLISL